MNIPTPMGTETVSGQRKLTAAKQVLLEKWSRGASFGARRAPAQVISRRPNAAPAPLSFSQRGLWFFNQLQPGSALYNIPIAVRLRGVLCPYRLQMALDAIAARHEVLRTHFATRDGDPMQFVSAASPVPMRVIDLTCQPPTRRESEAARLLEEEARRPFELSADVLIRALLLQIDQEEWIFLVVNHHIASDLLSWRVLCRELETHYQAFASGGTVSLPELPIQYADFAVWQQQGLGEGPLEKHLAYWRKQLAGAPGLLDVPGDHPRPAVQTFRGAREFLALPPGLNECLADLSRREGVTLFMTFVAAFQCLLHRYTGLDDFLVGSPVAGRPRLELESLIGLFVNTLVFRASLEGDPSFRQLLIRVRAVVLEALAHQDVPFERLVQEVQPGRSTSHSPLVQVMFAYNHAPAHSLRLPGLTATPLEVDTGTAKFGLSLSVLESDGALTCLAEYNSDLFERPTIRRMLQHYQRLLEGIMAHPELRLSELPLLTPGEERLLLSAWKGTAAQDFPGACVHQLFEEQVAKTPDAVAVVFDDQELSYRELDRRANQLAHRLRGLGVGPESLAGICLDRPLAMVVGLLGILKAGAAFVPLDPFYPAERLRFMVEDSKVSALLTQRRWLDQLPAHGPYRILLDSSRPGNTTKRLDQPDSGVMPNNLMYVMYTSGSTGQPKGVMIEHRGVADFLQWMRRNYPLTPSDRVLHTVPFTFDVSIRELFWPLISGSRVILTDRQTQQDISALTRLVVRHQATHVRFVPSVLELFLDQPKVQECACLKRVFCGGEAMPAALPERFFARLNAELHNTYGPTETSINATAWACRRDEKCYSVPIGRPIANTRVYILDRRLKPVPIGVPGELCIAGVSLARGYLNRPDLTAEKFVPNPFAVKGLASAPATSGQNAAGELQPDGRLYRTGDRCRYRADGAVEFLGRTDDQVKIRGYRLELGEIESVLKGHPAVREAAVALREDTPRDPRLVAYFVPQPDHAVTMVDLRRFLRGKLPDFAVPSVFVPLDRLLRTSSGKLDRKALPAPALARPELDEKLVAPRTPTEEGIAAIWCQVLGLPEVGVHDDFFELGGHSIRATQVVSRVRQSFAVELPLLRVFQGPTVARLAAAVEELVVQEITKLSEDRARALAEPVGK